MAVNVSKCSQRIKKVPPDGGYGWAIVAAFAISYGILVPAITNFGLIFKDKLTAMNLSASDISLVININSAFSMSMGLINGALQRNFGYRKIGIVSGAAFALGIILCSCSSNFISFVFTYGLLTAAGFGLSLSSFQLAISTYFLEKRNKATGIAMSVAGIGPILFPPMVTYLLMTYGVNGTVLILGGISIHTVMAALMLQPIKWHMKLILVQPEEEVLIKECSDSDEKSDDVFVKPGFYIGIKESNANSHKHKHSDNIDLSSGDEEEPVDRSYNYIDHDIDMQSIYGCEQMPIVRKMSTKQVNRCDSAIHNSYSLKELNSKYIRSSSVEGAVNAHLVKPRKRWFETGSIDTINLGSAVDIFGQRGLDRNESKRLMHSFSRIVEEENKTAEEMDEEERRKSEIIQEKIAMEKMINEKQHTSFWRAVGRWTVHFFDLDLLRDKTYVNILLGISFAIFAEFNFSILTPFILYEMDFSTVEVASLMSTVAISDVISRFVSPWIGDYFEQSSRIMYMISLVFLVVIRMAFLWVSSYSTMIFIMIILGIGRGIRTVYMNVIIPDHVPIERLASASGLQMVTNGIFLLIFGSIIGVMRDISGTYASCIVFINVVTVLTLIMWSVELIYVHVTRTN
ncbi:monocarboxylate transporter 13-like [Bradysia coprophila]|uniref:monocarboxylate transporter 13-like n=1 Tax=Bradysia coprophila TaxID=38358 RepID=UPI00187DB3EB|nr:monocarboxylate transporter 13-like [Bradysia coprophila]